MSQKSYTRSSGCPTFNFAVIVVRHPDTGKYLAVDESRNRGWWLPAGFVDPGENFVQAAHRETLEEAGVAITLRGILRVEHTTKGSSHARMRVIFFAEPSDPDQPPKSEPDDESNGAAWVTLEELQAMHKKRVLRGGELLEWAEYLNKGGVVFPMGILTEEGDEPPPPSELVPFKPVS